VSASSADETLFHSELGLSADLNRTPQIRNAASLVMTNSCLVVLISGASPAFITGVTAPHGTIESDEMPTARSKKADLYIGTQIRAARLERGISQTALGDVLDITFQQIQKYENGTNRISAGALFELAEFLDKPVTWFFPTRK
jgi:DNA-binding XRE family transcriptional regulator